MIEFKPLPTPDTKTYEDVYGNLWKCGGMTEDGYYLMFECDPETLEWSPETSYAEEFSPWEMEELMMKEDT